PRLRARGMDGRPRGGRVLRRAGGRGDADAHAPLHDVRRGVDTARRVLRPRAGRARHLRDRRVPPPARRDQGRASPPPPARRAAAALFAPVATVWIMLCAGSLGLFLFNRRSIGVVAVLAAALALVAARVVAWTPRFMTPVPGDVPSLADVVVLFGVIGGVTFGGSLPLIRLLQDPFVHQPGWLPPRAVSPRPP